MYHIFMKYSVLRSQMRCRNLKNVSWKIYIAATYWNIFVCINSAANFLLYMVKGKKFREAFCQTYFSCKSSNVLPNHSTNLTMMSRMNSSVNKSISIRKNYSTKNEINWNYTLSYTIIILILIGFIWLYVPCFYETLSI